MEFKIHTVLLLRISSRIGFRLKNLNQIKQQQTELPDCFRASAARESIICLKTMQHIHLVRGESLQSDLAAITKHRLTGQSGADCRARTATINATTLKGSRAAYLCYVCLWEAFTFIFSMKYAAGGMRKEDEDDVSYFFFPLPQIVRTEAAALHKGSELNATSDAHVDSGWAHYPLGDPPSPPITSVLSDPGDWLTQPEVPGYCSTPVESFLLLNKAVYYSSIDYIFPYTSKTMLVPTLGCLQNGRINLSWNNIMCLYFLQKHKKWCFYVMHSNLFIQRLIQVSRKVATWINESVQLMNQLMNKDHLHP